MNTASFVLRVLCDQILNKNVLHDASEMSAADWFSCRDYALGIHALPIFFQGLSKVPSTYEQEVEETLKRERMLLAMLDEEMFQAAHALNSNGIEFMVVKGMELGRRIYARRSLRPMTDVDLLVSESEFEHAIDSLKTSGFQIAGLHTAKRFRVELSRSAEAPVVELHRKLLASDSSEDTSRYWNNALDGNSWALPDNAKILREDDCFSYLLRHGAVQHAIESPIWLFDLHLIANSLEKNQWTSIVSNLIKHKACAAAWLTLSLLRNELGTRVPENSLEMLARPLSSRRLKALSHYSSFASWFKPESRTWIQIARARYTLRDTHRDAFKYAIERALR